MPWTAVNNGIYAHVQPLCMLTCMHLPDMLNGCWSARFACAHIHFPTSHFLRQHSVRVFDFVRCSLPPSNQHVLAISISATVMERQASTHIPHTRNRLEQQHESDTKNSDWCSAQKKHIVHARGVSWLPFNVCAYICIWVRPVSQSDPVLQWVNYMFQPVRGDFVKLWMFFFSLDNLGLSWGDPVNPWNESNPMSAINISCTIHKA